MDSEKDAREQLPRLSAEDCERMREHALAGMRPPMTIRFWVVNLVEECRRLREERDARPDITAEDAASFVRFYDSPATCNSREWNAAQSVLEALRAHGRRVQP